MPLLTITGPARAVAGTPDAAEDLTEGGALAPLHGLHSEDELCADYLDGLALDSAGVAGGRLRFVLDEATGRLRISTSYLVPRRLEDGETAALVEATIEQWSDGIGAGAFVNHAGEVLSVTLAKALRNQDPGADLGEVFVEAYPMDAAEEDVAVAWSDGGDPDAHLLEDLEWAAARGLSSASYELAIHLQEGVGCEVDLPRAAELYRAAAEAGHGMAMGMLGDMYREGHGVPEDPAQAVAWFRRGMEAGVVECKAEYADCLETGTGIEKDLVRARELYRECLADGFEPVAEALERVAGLLGG